MRAALLFAAFSILVVVGYTVGWKAAPVETSDSAGYYEVARDLQDFRLQRIHYRPPGYPLWLRVLGFTNQRATKRLVTAGLSLHVISVWMLALALRGNGVPPGAIATFCLVLALPPFVQPAAYVLSENLTQFLLVLTFSATLSWIRGHRWRYLWLAGGAMASAALTKPTYQALPVAMALCLTFCAVAFSDRRLELRRYAMGGALLVVASSLPIIGFATFNFHQFGRFTTSPGNLSYSLSTKTVRVLERIPDEYAAAREAMIAARDEHLVERGSSHTAGQYYPSAKAAVAEATGLEGRELEALLLHLNLQLIVKAPLHYALHVGQSVVAFWFPTVDEINTGGSSLIHMAFACLHFLVVFWFFVQLAVLGGLGIFEVSRLAAAGRFEIQVKSRTTASQITAYAVAFTFILYTMAVSCLVHHGEPRFRTVTDPLIVFLCFLGGTIWWRIIAHQPVSSTPSRPRRIPTSSL